MIPLIIIIALVVAGIVLILIQNRKEKADIDTSDWKEWGHKARLARQKALDLEHERLAIMVEAECASLAHPADPVTLHHHKKPVKKQSANKPKWIAHKGNEMPVSGDTLVHVKYKDGRVSLYNPTQADFWRWDTSGEWQSDIAFYRIHSPKSKKRVTLRKKQVKAKSKK
jgi:hypothetical protein